MEKWEMDRKLLLEERERVLRLAEPLRKLNEAAESFKAAVNVTEVVRESMEQQRDKVARGRMEPEKSMDLGDDEENALLGEEEAGSGNKEAGEVDSSDEGDDGDGKWTLVTGRKGTREYEQNVRRRRNGDEGDGSRSGSRRGSDEVTREGKCDGVDNKKKEE
jgi:hypothetical protein